MEEYRPLLHERKDERKRKNYAPVAYALLASISSAMAGYCCGVMSGAVLFIKDDLEINESKIELLMGSLVMVSLFGGLVTGFFADAIGRRKTILVGALIVFLGCLTMGFAPSFDILLSGRILTGFGIGFSYVIVPLYIAELAPPESRGTLASLPEIFINSGILLGFVSSFCLSGLPVSMNWRLMLVLGAIPAIILAGGVLILPESPRWLVMKHKGEEALSVLIRTSTCKLEAEARLLDIFIAADVPHQKLTGSFEVLNKGDASDFVLEAGAKLESHKEKRIWVELLCPANSQGRKVLFIALGLQFFQQASGVAALIYYAPAVFREAGSYSETGDLGATVMVGLAKTVFILVATLLLDRTGRRPLLLISNLGMSISMLTLAGSFLCIDLKCVAKQEEANTPFVLAVIVGATMSFVSFFSMGYGPICGLLASEVFPLRHRARGMSLAMAFNRGLSGVISLTFLSTMSALTPTVTFFLCFAMSVVSLIFVYFVVPETKGKNLEDISK